MDPVNNPTYVLITAPYNEEEYIEKCINSVLEQSVLPKKWVIVSDGSTDNTDSIVRRYESQFKFISFFRKEKDFNAVGFASKVQALNFGAKQFNAMDYQFIGHLDADITLQKDYYEKILERFIDNIKFGICGGFVKEIQNGVFENRVGNSSRSVAGGIQLFRRKLYEELGGIKPIPLGGEDWYCEIKARMYGWSVVSFPEHTAFHHKPGALKRGQIKEAQRSGALDFIMGTHPFFIIFKCFRRLGAKPYGIVSLCWLYGYLNAWLIKKKQYVDIEIKHYLRTEQLQRLKDLLPK